MSCPTPVSAAECAQLFSSFAHHDRVLLAVSGGRDSIALLSLACSWQLERQTANAAVPHLFAATVDHGLRPEAREEADHAASICASFGIEHRLLTIDETAPDSGLQMWARSVRYSALTALAQNLDCTAIATGHQADDQAQTVLMRLARGSGIDGLGAMRSVSQRNSTELLRPLLPIPRDRLTASLNAENLSWRDDPSNWNPQFERSTFDQHADSLQALGLTCGSIGLSAQRLQDARDALDWAVDGALDRMPQCRQALSCGYAIVDATPFLALPRELKRRVLSRLMEAVSGELTPPRLDRLEALVAQLSRSDAHLPPQHTLGGCIVSKRGETIVIFREPGRRGFPVLELEPGQSAVWDRRFLVRAADTTRSSVQVRAFNAPPVDAPSACLQDARDAAPRSLPGEVRAALPAFWQNGALLAVPHLGFSRPPYQLSCDVSDCPNLDRSGATERANCTFVAVSTTKIPDRNGAAPSE